LLALFLIVQPSVVTGDQEQIAFQSSLPTPDLPASTVLTPPAPTPTPVPTEVELALRYSTE
jgi:hypothetical protein